MASLDVPKRLILSMEKVRDIVECEGYDYLICETTISTLPEQIRPLIAALREGMEALAFLVEEDSPEAE